MCIWSFSTGTKVDTECAYVFIIVGEEEEGWWVEGVEDTPGRVTTGCHTDVSLNTLVELSPCLMWM